MTTKNKAETIIYVYGFDAAGFEIKEASISLQKNIKIDIIPFNSSKSIDQADGVIIKQGIFEEIHYKRYFNKVTADVKHSEELMLGREREVMNLLREGKWVVFLVDEIIDSVYVELRHTDISDTDLCKRLLNKYGIERDTIEAKTSLNAVNEFRLYVREYGIASTVFRTSDHRQYTCSQIIKYEHECVGFEIDNTIFFLPFHTTKYDQSAAESIVRLVTQSVLDYRQKHIAKVPEWIKTFEFGKETESRNKISELSNQIHDIEQLLYPLERYKLIINTSGELLKKVIVDILESFFGFKVDSIDEMREDAKILDEKDNAIVMIELKGTKTGIKREYINQVDIHRERNDLTKEVPGVLIINNEMDVEGIEERLNTNVPSEQIKHAVTMNVLIVRTIDFLFLMKHLESDAGKKELLMELINSGGGWLKADRGGYGIMNS